MALNATEAKFKNVTYRVDLFPTSATADLNCSIGTVSFDEGGQVGELEGVANGTEVTLFAKEPGPWLLEALHNQHGGDHSVEASEEELVFKFLLTKEQFNQNSAQTGPTKNAGQLHGVYINEDAMYVDAGQDTPVGQPYGGWVQRFYYMEVLTDPAGAYSGAVRARAKIRFAPRGAHVIYTQAIGALNYVAGAFTVDLGPVEFIVTGIGVGEPTYGSFGTGINTQIWIEDDQYESDVEGVTEKHEFVEVPPLVLWDSGRSWNPTFPGPQSRNDKERTYNVGSTQVEFRVKVGAAARIGPVTGDIPIAKGSCNIQPSSLDVEEVDDAYEIIE